MVEGFQCERALRLPESAGPGERSAGQRRGALSDMSSCGSAGQGHSTAEEAVHTIKGWKAMMCKQFPRGALYMLLCSSRILA